MMKIKAIILDFDQTIADTSKVEYLRKQRRWDLIEFNLNDIHLMDGFLDFYKYLISHNIQIVVLSKSPRKKYLEKLLSHLQIEVDLIIGYEDVYGKVKPDSYGMHKVLDLLSLSDDEVISIGDHTDDIVSAGAAGIKSIYYSSVSIKDENCMLSTTNYQIITEFVNSYL